jgi:hypothetical protein
MYAPRGAYFVTAKLPEPDGEFEYRIRSASEEYEHLARESTVADCCCRRTPICPHGRTANHLADTQARFLIERWHLGIVPHRFQEVVT